MKVLMKNVGTNMSYKYTIKLEANISPIVPSIVKFENSINELLTHMGLCEAVKIRGNVLDLVLISTNKVSKKEKAVIQDIILSSFNEHFLEYDWSILNFYLEESDGTSCT